ncbi:MAG: cell division protein FtsZ [Cytophagales bacterium]|nr:MAG: cell division protein FtsZ [Cytophagales bacterium]
MFNNSYKFELPSHHKSIIKVIGVGGGGSNAVNHMFKQGIKDVEFVVCNTDAQALNSSPVPTKLQIGLSLTDGLGAGANPERGRNAALESKEDIREFMSNNTRMIFITAGMGGGTGTGAAPVIAKIAKELDILTVGIVTAPFSFEGKKKRQQADQGICELRENCDTMLVIENDKLRMIYGNLSIRDAFAQADNVLSTAAKSIAEIITVTSDVNVDFEDVKTVMKDSGAAVMGSSVARGDNRARRAAEESLASPLLNNTNILGAKKILLSIAYGDEGELTMDELTEITDFIEEKAGDNAEMIFGQGLDTTLGDQVRVTVIATGFLEANELDLGFAKEETKKVIDLESQKTIKQDQNLDKRQITFEFDSVKPNVNSPKIEVVEKNTNPPTSFISDAHQDASDLANVQAPNHGYDFQNPKAIKDEKDEFELKRKFLMDQAKERIKRLGGQSPSQNMNPDEFKEKLEIPAYLRKQVVLKDFPHSSDKNISRYNLNDDNEILGNNKFLHDNVD